MLIAPTPTQTSTPQQPNGILLPPILPRPWPPLPPLPPVHALPTAQVPGVDTRPGQEPVI